MAKNLPLAGSIRPHLPISTDEDSLFLVIPFRAFFLSAASSFLISLTVASFFRQILGTNPVRFVKENVLATVPA